MKVQDATLGTSKQTLSISHFLADNSVPSKSKAVAQSDGKGN